MTVESLITQHIDTWTSSVKTQSTSGRGSRKKLELYGVKKLRELILELAVRGKLVPQDPNDEPASVLLERIAAEKVQLVKEKKIKKPKKPPSIDEIELPNYILPIGWKWAFIPEVVAHDNYAIKRGPFGSALKKAYFVASGYKVYEQQHAINDDFLRGEYYVDEKKFEELKAFEVKPFDLIISCSGTVGTVAIAPVDMERGIINQALLKISLNTSALTNEYFKILFPAYYMKTETLSDLQGTAQKNMVSVETLKSEPFPYPPIEEQHRIVAKVDELMALCDQLEQQTEASIETHQLLVSTLLNTLTNSADADELMENWTRISDHFDTLFTTEASIDQLKQTILQLAVMGKLVPQDPNDEPASVLLERLNIKRNDWLLEFSGTDNECKTMLRKLKQLGQPKSPFPLPKTWVCVHLIELSRLLVDCHNKTAPYVDSGIPIIRTTNIREQKFVNKDLKYVNQETYEYWSRRCPPQHGDIMFTREAPMGEALIVPEGSKWCLGQRTMLIRPMHDYVSNEFLLLALTEPHLLERASEHAVGLTVKHLRVGDVENLNVPIPPLREQYEIVSRVNELMVICDQLKQRLKESQITQLYLTDTIVEQAV
ncbi:restriction endonuclease subunit S [Photobacterium phosphoreum]|uniref:restriction endonuclease subunit S n=1 Tax=Photobacterium phosphoreum TaxID=659 RepID=UPI000D170659|nr:restriction endonuclease subunit S [Photobacterium phosphoreum]PSU76113.1 type I restriction endonuclease subunit S [Photobacterium phosphoreum]